MAFWLEVLYVSDLAVVFIVGSDSVSDSWPLLYYH